MHHNTQSALKTKQNPRTASVRLKPVIHLCTGDTVGAFVEHAIGFDEKPTFDFVPKTAPPSPANWVANRILDIASMCDTLCFTDRPIVIPVPGCAINDPDLLKAVIKAIGQTKLCHQEISLELPDAALTTAGEKVYEFVSAFRKYGFRVSIDARISWNANLPGHTWLMIDTLRINADEIDTHSALEVILEIANAAGVAIVAQKPYWRDGDYLASIGIQYGLMPRADA